MRLASQEELIERVKELEDWNKTYKESLALANQTIAELQIDARRCSDLIDENIIYRKALETAKETIEYVKQYVENRGLSAEDDCDEALEEIEQSLNGKDSSTQID